MQKRDPLAFGADTRALVDESDPCVSASVERGVEVIDGEAHVVNSGSALRHVARDGRVGRGRLEELDERLACGESRDAGAVGVIELDGRETEHVAVEWHELVEGTHGDSNVRDARPARGGWHRNSAEAGERGHINGGPRALRRVGGR